MKNFPGIPDFLGLISKAKEKNLAYAAWKSPGELNPNFIAGNCRKDNILNVREHEFVISSFDNQNQVIIEPSFLLLNGREIINSDFTETVISTGKQFQKPYYFQPVIISDHEKSTHHFYTSLVASTIRNLNSESFPKAVIARKKLCHLKSSFEPLSYFFKLADKYKDAFVYLFSSQLTGTWTGASPELLLSCREKTLKAVALAGTRSELQIKEKVAFTQKELVEQEIVSRHLRFCFQEQNLHFTESRPMAIRAGNVSHIKTVFESPSSGADVFQLLNSLHPTPAVSGFPKEKAIHYIIEKEQLTRSWYSGYLGFYNNSGDFCFYVNLRCMEIKEEQAVLYAGAGILMDSDPESEWIETENKLQTLLSLMY